MIEHRVVSCKEKWSKIEKTCDKMGQGRLGFRGAFQEQVFIYLQQALSRIHEKFQVKTEGRRPSVFFAPFRPRPRRKRRASRGSLFHKFCANLSYLSFSGYILILCSGKPKKGDKRCLLNPNTKKSFIKAK